MNIEVIMIINSSTRDYYTFATVFHPGGVDWDLYHEIVDSIKMQP